LNMNIFGANDDGARCSQHLLQLVVEKNRFFLRDDKRAAGKGGDGWGTRSALLQQLYLMMWIAPKAPVVMRCVCRWPVAWRIPLSASSSAYYGIATAIKKHGWRLPVVSKGSGDSATGQSYPQNVQPCSRFTSCHENRFDDSLGYVRK
jgi:hypothetical protein